LFLANLNFPNFAAFNAEPSFISATVRSARSAATEYRLVVEIALYLLSVKAVFPETSLPFCLDSAAVGEVAFAAFDSVNGAAAILEHARAALSLHDTSVVAHEVGAA